MVLSKSDVILWHQEPCSHKWTFVCVWWYLGPTWGPVEFVLTARNVKRSPVGFVVEVKQEDFNQDRAQLYMQLKAARTKNAKNGVECKVLGAITNAESWLFVLYDGERFYETKKCLVGQSPAFDYIWQPTCGSWEACSSVGLCLQFL